MLVSQTCNLGAPKRLIGFPPQTLLIVVDAYPPFLVA
jgi:hypothetical protein